MKVKEECEKTGLKLNILKTKIMGSGPISSVHFSCSAGSDSLQPHGLQYARFPCLSLCPRVSLSPKALTFVGKVMSLLLNTLSRFVIAFLQGASIF